MFYIFCGATNRSAIERMKRRKRKSKRRHKRQRAESQEDRISLLPDCLLVDIITRLPETQEAIRTGTLSKRWQHLWPQVPDLIYIYDVEYDHRKGFGEDGIAKFFSFFEKTLIQRGQLNIHKFILHCSHNHKTESQLINCICYAINNNVKEFYFKVWDYIRYNDVLPGLFFTSSSFVHLRLSKYNFCNHETGVISWKNIRTLRLKKIEFHDDLIENILSGSPLLETLELADCLGVERLNITNKSVKNLVLTFGFLEHGYLETFEVNAPYIYSLTIQKYCTLEKLLLLNVSSVVKAELNYFNTVYYAPYESFEEMLRELILSLGHAKEIIIGKLCLQAFALLKAKGFIYPSNLKILEDIDSN